jgi:transcriptional regulator with XRE-family HTH domain
MSTGHSTLGALLRKHRIRRGLTQGQLADRAGVAQGALSQWENDKRDLSLRNAVLLTSALDIPLDELAAPFRPRPSSRRRPQLRQIAS